MNVDPDPSNRRTPTFGNSPPADGSTAAPLRWTVRLLGGLEVRLGNAAPIKFTRARDAALCGFLAFYAEHWHAREALAERWWPGIETTRGLRHLSSALSHLRRVLDTDGLPAREVICSDTLRVRFNPEHIVTDVSAFEAALDLAGSARLTHAGEIESAADVSSRDRAQDVNQQRAYLEEALRLYRGDLLPDTYDDWLAPERARLAERRQWALVTLGDLVLQSGGLARALDLARRAGANDPLDEGVTRLAMRALLSQGQAARALEDYRRLETRLKSELGLAPDHETQQLARLAWRQIDAAAITTPAKRKRQPQVAEAAGEAADESLYPVADARYAVMAEPSRKVDSTGHEPAGRKMPTPLGAFVGREAELRRLDRLVGRPPSRLVTITGPGGAGKTRLALEFGRQLGAGGRAESPLVVFVGLEQAREAMELLDAAIAALGLTPDDAPPRDQLVEMAARRPVLLILDNLEHLLPAAARLVSGLLRDAPLLSCLVTSRRRLDVVGEHELPLLPLAVPAPEIAHSALLDWPSVQLFGLRAQAADPTFRLEDHARAVAALCARLDGLPLALELAAARAAVLSPAEMLQRLGTRLAWLSGREVDRPARHRSLEAALDWSINLLAPEHRRLFARLSIFHGGFSLEDAEAVCGDASPLRVKPAARLPSSGTGILDGVEALRAASLLLSTDLLPGGPRRFRLLATVRDYAAACLTPEDQDTLAARHAVWFANVAASGRRDEAVAPAADWLRLMDDNIDNLRAALHWLTTSPAGAMDAVALATAMVPYWEQRGMLTEARSSLEPLVLRMSSTSVGGHATAELLEAAGTIAFYLGDVAAARQRFLTALEGFRAAALARGRG